MVQRLPIILQNNSSSFGKLIVDHCSTTTEKVKGWEYFMLVVHVQEGMATYSLPLHRAGLYAHTHTVLINWFINCTFVHMLSSRLSFLCILPLIGTHFLDLMS